MAEEKTIRTALQQAQKDPVFAVELVQHPEKFAKEFNLSAEHIQSLTKGREVMQSALKAGIIGVDLRLPIASSVY